MDKILRLSVKVTPNAKKDEVQEDIMDFFGNRSLKIRTVKPAIDGKANFAIVDILSDYFNVPKKNVIILSGMTARNKIIEVKLA